MKKPYDYLAGVKRSMTKARMFSVWRPVLLVALAVALCDSNVALAQTVTRGPYLQLGSSTGVVIRWRTDLPTNGRVRFGFSPAALTNIGDSSTVRTDHAVRLTGLTPDTLYYYSVGNTNQVLAGGDSSHFFVTAPPTGVAQPTRIWVIGDSGTADANAVAVRDAYLNFTGARHTDLWLMLGDSAYQSGTDAEFQNAVFNMYPMLLRQSVLWPTLGCHDSISADSTSQSGPYFDIFSVPRNAEAGGVASGTEAYYSFDFGNIHFIVLDSFETSRAPNGAMLTWLTSDLAATTQPWIIAYWHHPPYSKGNHDSDTDPIQKQMRENVLPILEAGGVDLVLTGHAHWYQRSYLVDGHYGLSSSFTAGMKVDGGSGRVDDTGPYEKSALDAVPHQGAVYVVAGSSGKLSPALNHPSNFILLNKLGSVVLDIDGNRLDARFIDNAGAVGDYFTIMKGGTTQKLQVDFDGDKKSDVAVYRNGAWFIVNSNGGSALVGWGGAAQDIPVQADYDGDGKSDVAVFRDGVWFILNSSGGSQFVGWGTAGDVPVPGDYDGDGKTDVAVYRNGAWFIVNSSGGSALVGWGGAAQDIPVQADYDGDGKSDVAVFRDGAWFILNSSGGSQFVGWGTAGDVPVPGDYDGDGKTDVAVYRDGVWFINNSNGGTQAMGWGGAAQDVPVPADYDGDGKTDVAIFRDGAWYILKSSGGTQVVGWGTAGDVPIN